jgi:hypothetical protein
MIDSERWSKMMKSAGEQRKFSRIHEIGTVTPFGLLG